MKDIVVRPETKSDSISRSTITTVPITGETNISWAGYNQNQSWWDIGTIGAFDFWTEE